MPVKGARALAGPEIEDLTADAVPGAVFELRVTPRAGRVRLHRDCDGRIHVRVTEAPDDGKANAAVLAALARALGVAKGRLTLVRGASARTKTVRLD